MTSALFYVNWEKDAVAVVINEWANACLDCGIVPLFLDSDRVYAEDCITVFEKCSVIRREDVPLADMVFTFGGDGTMIRALDSLSEYGKPFLGVNLGRMGFLLEAERTPQPYLAQLLRGDYQLEERMMLRMETVNHGIRLVEYATNEISISRGMSQRMIAMDVKNEEAVIEHYIADGIILATPTGSTAYSLAAGGPIVSPGVECILVNPICAHTLQSRPLILPPEESLTVSLNMKEERKGSILSADGRTICTLENGDEVRVTRSPYRAKLIRFEKQTRFFTLIKEKLSIATL